MSKTKPLFVTGIGTGVGKTIVAALLTQKLMADYWKPIQSGDLDNSDSAMVQSLISNPVSKIHPEAYRLTQPLSPHHSAMLDGLKIEEKRLAAPVTDNQLVIEGAGGLMVPLNDTLLMIDLITKFDAEVAVVVKHYLGSINHTLLTLNVLKNKNIPVKYLIINGAGNDQSEKAILNFSTPQTLVRVPEILEMTKPGIAKIAAEITL